MSNSGIYTNTFTHFYDLIYGDKDYAKESSFILHSINLFHPHIQDVLELGCGTGNYTQYFLNEPWNMYALDISPNMVEEFQSKGITGVELILEDLLKYQNPGKFDVILALFNVLGYLNSDLEVHKCFQNAFRNLKQNGLFYFDVWNKPGVHFHGFKTKVKKIENDDFIITRISESEFNENRNLVKVDFNLFVEERKTGHIHKSNETHWIRPFEKDEIDFWAKENGLQILSFEESYTGQPILENTWLATYILKKP